MLILVERECVKTGRRAEHACVTWTLDGRAFIIHNQDELVKTILPRIFQRSKFASFTRKLYRWGFRQVFTDGAAKKSDQKDLIFANENFQRDNKSLMANMRSTTAEGVRRDPTLRQRTGSPKTSSDEKNKPTAPTETSGLSSPIPLNSNQGGQLTLREDILALLASQSAMPRPVASALPAPAFQQASFGGPDLSLLNSLPVLTNIIAQQQGTFETPHQNTLLASLLMSAGEREPSMPLTTQHHLLASNTYAMNPSIQPRLQDVFAAYLQQQQDQDAAARVRQLLVSLLSQSNQYLSVPIRGQNNPSASDQSHTDANRDATRASKKL